MNSKQLLLLALLFASPACAQDIQNPRQPANPSATIGASAVNGSAQTFMRSDAAPALPSTLPALNGSALTALAGANITAGSVPNSALASTYAQQSGITTWTPTDASGAGLTFTSVNVNYTRIGNIVYAYGYLQYPSTVSGANAAIGGLPVAVPNSNYANIPGALFNSTATLLFPLVPALTPNSSAFRILNDFSGAAVTNAQISGDIIQFMLIYPTQ